jgi:outer membrane beta-barrel protein/carboxypeptidase family protein
MRLLSLLLFLSCFAQTARSQRNGFINGRLLDTTAHQPVGDATITLLHGRDSTLVSFTRSMVSGSFQIGSPGPGQYRLLITHVGYRPISMGLTLTATSPGLSLGTVFIARKTDQLSSVTVEPNAPPVVIHGDTIEFNAGFFKTKPDAVVEDLLKKLPGVQVDKNGTITANGREVKKVLVDGKEFFGNDPKIATKNLPADAVDKVQVFDKKSDQSQFTGFDDGNSQQTINLTIKKERKNGVFGKATAGYGIDGADKDTRYEARFNLNQFSGDRQFSAIGMANNTNKQGFGFQDILGFSNGAGPGGGGGNNGGLNTNVFNSGVPLQDLLGNSRYITTTTAGGVNFNDSWRQHADINGNYFYNGTVDHLDERDVRQNLLPGNAFIQDQNLAGIRHNDNQRFTLIPDQWLDSANSVKLTSSLILQRSNSSTTTIDTSRGTAADSLLNSGSARADSYLNGYSWNNSALIRHRFAAKGRTLSATLSFGLNSTDGGGNLSSTTNYYIPAFAPHADTIDQTYRQSGSGNSYGINLAYTEPLSRRSLLEFYYNYYRRSSRANKTTLNADPAGKYDLVDTALTDTFRSSYAYDQERVQFRHQRRKWNFTVGASVQEAGADNRFGYLTGDSSIRQHWVNVLPNANLECKFDGYHNLRLFYTTYTNPPAISQLQPVADNSDPLNIKAGNPALQPEFYHMVRLSYISHDPFRRTSLFAFLNYTGIHDRIVNDNRVTSSGVSTIRPVNFKGLYRSNAFLGWEFPWRELKSKLNFNSSIVYDHSGGLVNGQSNYSDNWTVTQNAQMEFILGDVLDVTGEGKVSYYDTRYSLAGNRNQNYWLESYTLDLNWYLSHGFSIASDLEYVHRNGLPPGYNSNPLVWNAGIAKQVFRNKKGMVRLQVFDILRQNTGVARNTDQNYIDDVSYKVLRQYYMLSFTYSISRFAGKALKMGGGNRPDKPDIKIMR